MKVEVNSTLICVASGVLDIPVESFDEIKDWYVKWDTFHYTLNGIDWLAIDINSNTEDCIDWKWPAGVEVYDPETAELIAEKE